MVVSFRLGDRSLSLSWTTFLAAMPSSAMSGVLVRRAFLSHDAPVIISQARVPVFP